MQLKFFEDTYHVYKHILNTSHDVYNYLWYRHYKKQWIWNFTISIDLMNWRGRYYLGLKFWVHIKKTEKKIGFEGYMIGMKKIVGIYITQLREKVWSSYLI